MRTVTFSTFCSVTCIILYLKFAKIFQYPLVKCTNAKIYVIITNTKIMLAKLGIELNNKHPGL